MSKISTQFQITMVCGFSVDGDKKKISMIQRLHKLKCPICSTLKNIDLKNYKDNYDNNLNTKMQDGLRLSNKGNVVKK
jgi:hypothetical protein